MQPNSREPSLVHLLLISKPSDFRKQKLQGASRSKLSGLPGTQERLTRQLRRQRWPLLRSQGESTRAKHWEAWGGFCTEKMVENTELPKQIFK
jgi:hypothetical protein